MTDEEAVCCAVCGDPREEWDHVSVLIGELTREDINHQRQKDGLDPFCGSHDCMMALSGELVDMFGTLLPAPRFGGPRNHGGDA